VVKALFDSNILIDHLAYIPAATVEFERYPGAAISIVSWIEVMAGAPRAATDETRQFLKNFEIITLDAAVAEEAVSLRRTYRLKLPDAVIWTSARVTGRLLITRDQKAFPVDDPRVRFPDRLP
jgi:predicted nucleic acid-binding protein